MLPSALSVPFTVDEARDLGVSKRALFRLIRAGLCARGAAGRFLLTSHDEVQVALEGLGPGAVLCGESVATFLSWPLPSPPRVLHLAVPRTRTRQTWPGAVVHCRGLAPDEWCTFRGVRMTTPEVTAVDLAGVLALRDAVVLLDAALRLGNVSVKALRRRLVRLHRRPGTARAGLAVRLANRSRQSPLEAVFRVLVHEAGLPAPVEQFVIRAGTEFVARVDFAWPQSRLVVEIDGYEFHREIDAFVADRRRQNRLVLEGWRVLRFSAGDLYRQPNRVLAEVRQALLEAA